MGVGKYLYGQGCQSNYSVTGFTTYHRTVGNHDKTTIFQANHRYYGKLRYDWCLIQFDGEDDPENLICPSKTVEFVDFPKGSPDTLCSAGNDLFNHPHYN